MWKKNKVKGDFFMNKKKIHCEIKKKDMDKDCCIRENGMKCPLFRFCWM